MSPLNTNIQFKAEAEGRLDKAISQMIPDASRSQIQQTIKNTGAFVNDIEIFDCNYRLKINDLISFANNMPAKSLFATASAQVDFEVVYEDEHLLIINKPVGLTVHPGAGNNDNTLVNGLLARYGNSLSDIGGEFRPGIVHRLDKDTSGLMVVAKNNYSHRLGFSIRQYFSFCW